MSAMACRVVVDFDDLCDEFDPWEELHALKDKFPSLRVTLFAIPYRCSDDLLSRYGALDWVQLGVHGYHHAPMECATWGYKEAADRLAEIAEWWPGEKLFKAPGWIGNPELYDALLDGGWKVADNAWQEPGFGDSLVSRYIYNDYFNSTVSVHGHTWDCMGNGPSDWGKQMDAIPEDAEFVFVSDVCRVYEEPVLNADAVKVETDGSPYPRLITDPKPGQLFVDLGAYLGSEVEMALKDGLEVLALEPHPKFASFLRKRFGDGIELIEAAAWNRNGTKTLYPNAGGPSQSGSSLIKEKCNVAGKGIEVSTIDIAELLRDRKVDYLKLNVEGSEWVILERLLDEGLLDGVGKIFVEDHDAQITDSQWLKHRAKVRTRLREAGVDWQVWA